MDYTICDAAAVHLPQLAALERACFSAPWTRAQLAGQLGDDLHVRARGDLGYDAAVNGVQVSLGKDLIGQHLAPVAHEGDGRLVTGGFNRKNNHIVSASLRNQVMSNASSSGF